MKTFWISISAAGFLWGNSPAATISGGGSVVNTSPTPAEVTPTPVIKVDPAHVQMNKLLLEASARMDAKDFAGAGKLVDEANKVRPEDPEILAARAAIAARTGKIEDARAIYLKLKALQPTRFSHQYNIGELGILEHDYTKARTDFMAARAQFPDDEMLRFKIILTYLKENNADEAQKELERFKFPSNTPAYYFANAAMDLTLKNGRSANEWMKSAVRIYGQEGTRYFFRALSDLNMLPERARAAAAAAPPE